MPYQSNIAADNFNHRPGEPSVPVSPQLVWLLDAIDATEESGWTDLPPPIPLFLREVRQALVESLGFVAGGL